MFVITKLTIYLIRQENHLKKKVQIGLLISPTNRINIIKFFIIFHYQTKLLEIKVKKEQKKITIKEKRY